MTRLRLVLLATTTLTAMQFVSAPSHAQTAPLVMAQAAPAGELGPDRGAVLLLQRGGVGGAHRLEAGRVERDREVALGRRLPERVPVVLVERDAHALEAEVAALEAHLGAAAHLGRGGLGIVVGHDRQRVDPVGVRLLREVGGLRKD